MVAMLLLMAAMLLTGCTDRGRAAFGAYGEKHIIRLYSGGKVVETFTSTGKVECTDGGICDFVDASNGKFTRTTGDVVVQVQ